MDYARHTAHGPAGAPLTARGWRVYRQGNNP